MSPHLPGRAADLATITAVLDRVVDGSSSLLVTGDPGVGKSTLLDAAADHALGNEIRVLRVAGVAYPGAAPYAALDELLAPVHELIGKLAPADRNALSVVLGLSNGTPPHELAVAHSMLRLLRMAAEKRPVAVFVDHGQDLDDVSARTFALVARRPGRDRVAMIMASRKPWPHGVLQRAGLTEHHVGRLDDASATELLRSRYPDLNAQACGRIIDEGKGNPLAMLEYAGALTERQRTGSDLLPAVLPIGEHVRALTAAHFAGLPSATRDLLLLAALEDTGDLVTLQAATPGIDIIEAAAPAEQRQYIAIDLVHRRLHFLHPMLRAAFIENATKLEHRRAHRALAEALGADGQRQVVHLAAAAVGHDADLAEQLRRRAEAAIRRGDANTAVTLLSGAADLSADPAARSRRLLEAAFLRADVTGHLTDAANLLERATVSGGELAGALPVAVVASYVVLNGDIAVDVAHDLLAAAIDAYPRRWDADDETLIGALHLLLMNCWYSGDPASWEPFDRALERLRPRVPSLLEMCARTFGDPVRADHDVLQAVDHTASRLDDENNPITITRTALACIYVDRVSAVSDALIRVIRDGDQGGAAALAIHATISYCNYLWHSGQWSELAATAADGAARCERYGYRRYNLILAGYHLPLVAVVRGDTQAGLDAVEAMTAEVAVGGAGIIEQFACHVRSLAAISRGDFAEAYRQACGISAAGAFPRHTPHALWVLLELVEGAVRSGNRPAAQAHVEAMEAADIASLSPRLALCFAGCAAMVADTGEAYQNALAVRDADRWPFDQARILLAYGEHLRRKRQVAAARVQLGAALQVFQRLDARPWISRTTTALRAVGRSITPANNDTETLSAQERRIVELAADGLTNKEIGEKLALSHRTIGAHLYRIFPKLGVTSRAALRDALGRFFEGV